MQGNSKKAGAEPNYNSSNSNGKKRFHKFGEKIEILYSITLRNMRNIT